MAEHLGPLEAFKRADAALRKKAATNPALAAELADADLVSAKTHQLWTIHRARIAGNPARAAELARELGKTAAPKPKPATKHDVGEHYPSERQLTRAEIAAMKAVGEHHGNISAAARSLGKNPKTVWQQYKNGLKKLGRQSKHEYKESIKALPHDKRGQVAVAAVPEPEPNLD